MSPRIAALTIHQPWADLIAHGPKRTENRTWLPALDPGTFLAIHAGRYVTKHGQGLDHWHVAASVYAEQRKHIGPVPILDAFEAIPPNERDGARGEKYARSAVPYGAVVAVARYRGAMREPVVVRGVRDPWWCGPWGWCLDDVIALPEPVPCRGAQGLWSLDDEALARVRAGYRAALAARAGDAPP